MMGSFAFHFFILVMYCGRCVYTSRLPLATGRPSLPLSAYIYYGTSAVLSHLHPGSKFILKVKIEKFLITLSVSSCFTFPNVNGFLFIYF